MSHTKNARQAGNFLVFLIGNLIGLRTRVAAVYEVLRTFFFLSLLRR